MNTNQKPANNIDILIVEDSLTQAEELSNILIENNYSARIACGGKEALVKIKDKLPTIVISDILMPEMDGYELCQNIKKNENFATIPVMLLTSLSDPHDILTGLECGADLFVVKPYSEPYILSQINYMISNAFMLNHEMLEIGVEIYFEGKKYFINSRKRQILDLLLSTYETAVKKNGELIIAQKKLRELNETLEKKVQERTSLLSMEILVRKEAEKKLKRLNRVYEVLSNINKAIVQIKEQDVLLDETCKISVNVGLFDLVWIGIIDERDRTIKPAYWKGDSEGFVDNLIILLDTQQELAGTAGQAVKDNHFVLCNDILDNEILRARLEKAREKKFNSVLSIPLYQANKKFGVISFYSKEKNFFDDQEIKLLEELAMDVSFSLHNIELEKLRINTEAALAKSEERLKILFDYAPEAYFIIDPNGNFIDGNKKAEKLIGYKKHELMGKNFFDIKLISPNGIEKAKKIFEKSLFEPTGSEENILFHKDGSEIFVEITTYPIKLKDQKVVLGIARDITDRKKAEIALKESEEKHRTLFETMVQGVVYQNEKGEIISANRAAEKILGLSPDQMRGRTSNDPHWKAVHEDGSDFPGGEHPAMIALKTSKRVYNVIMGVFNASLNEYRWIKVDAIPQFRGKAKTPYRVYTTFDDITERKKLMEQLIEAKEKAEEMNKIKSYFFANMSHELRTPLVAILGYAEVLDNEISDPVENEMIKTIISSGKRLNTTLNNVLNITRLEAEKLIVELKKQDIIGLINEQIKLFKRLADEKSLTIILDKDEGKITITIDKELFISVISNLLSNAIKYTEKGGIQISVKRSEYDVIITVSDTGIGIQEEFQEVIFEPFRQASEGLSRRFEGTGLGLTIVKKYVEIMGGTISIKSKVKEGTKFIISFKESSNK